MTIVVYVPSYIDFGPTVEKAKKIEINVEVNTSSNIQKVKDGNLKIESN